MKDDGKHVAASHDANLLAQLPRLILRERELCAARLASTLTHTLGTPLQVIAGLAALARRASQSEDTSKHLEVIQRKCGEITTLLWRVLDSLRTERPRAITRIDPGPFVQHRLDELTGIAHVRGVRWDLRDRGSSGDSSEVNLCAEDLAHALVSVGLNVLAEAPDHSELVVVVDQAEQGGVGLTPVHEGLLRIAFRRVAADSPPHAQNPTEPWFHPEGKHVDGRVLGWATAYELARSNEGRLEVSAEEVTLFWPALSGEEEAAR